MKKASERRPVTPCPNCKAHMVGFRLVSSREEQTQPGDIMVGDLTACMNCNEFAIALRATGSGRVVFGDVMPETKRELLMHNPKVGDLRSLILEKAREQGLDMPIAGDPEDEPPAKSDTRTLN